MSTKAAVLGVKVNAVERHEATDRIVHAAENQMALGVSALAVHGLTLTSRDPELRYRINELELVVPDGQPVRWAMNLLHGCNLEDRVFGPSLMWDVCSRAAERGLPVFLYGSTVTTLGLLSSRLQSAFPRLRIAGQQPSRFRLATFEEAELDRHRIQESGARLVFVGLGCPRQEIWTYENREPLSMPVLAVGAAFDYHAGLLREAPKWMKRSGLEWSFRLMQEPARLWKRYLVYNTLFLVSLALEALRVRSFPTGGTKPAQPIRPS